MGKCELNIIEKYLSLFEQLDTNGDLYLDRAEEGKDIHEFDKIDLNKNGWINLAEWFKYKNEIHCSTLVGKLFSEGISKSIINFYKEDLSSGGIKKPCDQVRLLLSVVSATGENNYPDLALRALPEALSAIKSAGINDPEKIVELIKAVVSAAGEKSYLALGALLPAILDAGIDDPEKIIELIEAVVSAAGEDPDYAFRVLPVIFRGYKYNDDLNILIDRLEFLFRYSKSSYLTEIFSSLKLDVLKCTYNDLPRHLAEALDEYISGKEEMDANLFQSVAIWINKLHDSDNELNKRDALRTEIAKNLSPRAAYILLSLGGADLHTTSFQKIWEAQKVGDIKEWLQKVDPENRYVAEFILSLCNFNKTGVFEKESSFFINKAMDIIASSRDDKIVKNAALLIKLFDRLLPKASGVDKVRFASFLKERYKITGSGRNYNGSIAYLIKLYAGRIKEPELIAIAGSLPRPLRPSVPREKWLRDKTITAKLYFYPDEKWYEKSIGYYEGQGWQRDNAYMRKKGIGSGEKETVVFTEMVNGVRLRVILTKASEDKDDRLTSINDPEIDIIVHRGHSTHIFETFPMDGEMTARHKLFFGGSCGSFRDMSDGEFLMRYRENYLMADQDTGQGDVNNKTLTGLMENIAKGCKGWGDCIRNENGLILPDDASFLIGEYIHRLGSKSDK